MRNELRDEFEADSLNDGVDFANWVRNQSGYSSEEEDEYQSIKTLVEELQGMGGDHQWRGDWYPSTLIRDSYFEESMDEMVADCYSLPELPSFMTITLDYVALQMDYSSVEVDGVTYWTR